jgi:type VI secretion system protein ImpM
VPGADLTGEGFAGLFGKLPLAGDFVARGLPDAFRARWDAWVTRHLVPFGAWPDGGLRLCLLSGERSATALVLPFAPSVGEAEAWCEAALPSLGAAAAGGMGADALWAALDALPRPGGPGETPSAPLVLWARGAAAPLAADLADPGEALGRLSSDGSSIPSA